MIFVSPILEKFTPLRNDKYGWRDMGDGPYFHHGTDLRTNSNKAIVSAGKGKVSKIWFEPKGFGNAIYIDHKEGYQTRYAHLATTGSEFVKIGQEVQAGQQIGIMGTTGWSTGVHLHFEIRKNGASINPETVLDFTNRISIVNTNIVIPNNNNNINNNPMPNFTIPRSEAINLINAKQAFDTDTKKALVNAVYDNNFNYILAFGGEAPRAELDSFKRQLSEKDTTISTVSSDKEMLATEMAKLKLEFLGYKEKVLENEAKAKEENDKIKQIQANLQDKIDEEIKNAKIVKQAEKEVKEENSLSLSDRDVKDTLGDLQEQTPIIAIVTLIMGFIDLGIVSDMIGGGTLATISGALLVIGSTIASYNTNHAKNKRKIEGELRIANLEKLK